MSKTAVLSVAFVALSLPLAANAQTLVGRADSIYTWHSAMPAKALLTIRDYNGPIEVRRADGNVAEVRAEKRTRRSGGSIQDVAFEVQSGSNGDVTICSTYRDHNPCDDDSRRYRNDDRDWNDRGYVTVAITVLVPNGVELRVTTGNGDVSVTGAGADVQATSGNGRVRIDGTGGMVRATTGNGDVDVRNAKGSVRVTTGNGRVTVSTTEGPVEAHSGSGDIDVTMAQLKARDDMAFHTGNGSVRVTLPSGYSGELDATTGNGSIDSDFDLKLQSGRMNGHRIHATIGDGGPMLRLTTGNGRLELRKGS